MCFGFLKWSLLEREERILFLGVDNNAILFHSVLQLVCYPCKYFYLLVYPSFLVPLSDLG